MVNVGPDISPPPLGLMSSPGVLLTPYLVQGFGPVLPAAGQVRDAQVRSVAPLCGPRRAAVACPTPVHIPMLRGQPISQRKKLGLPVFEK